jgi:DNA repair photolyase
MSSVTDAYQGVEKKYELARGILGVVAASEFDGRFEILTKSPLVLRDLDHLSSIKNATVGMTVTTTSDEISRFLELRAPHATRRLDTLRRLNEAGIDTYAFIGPLLPHFKFAHNELDALFAEISGTGVRTVFVEHINMKKYIQERLNPQIAKTRGEIQDLYISAKYKEHRAELQEIVPGLLKKHGLRLRLNEVLYHNSR